MPRVPRGAFFFARRAAAFLRDNRVIVVAVVAHGALIAERLRLADAASVQNQRVGRPRPAFLRHAPRTAAARRFPDRRTRRCRFDSTTRSTCRSTGSPGHAERVSEHDVRRLAADARQLDERVHARGHLAAVIAHERLRHADERFRLRAKESGRVNQRLELGASLPSRASWRVGILLEQRRRDDVDALRRSTAQRGSSRPAARTASSSAAQCRRRDADVRARRGSARCRAASSWIMASDTRACREASRDLPVQSVPEPLFQPTLL